MFLKGAEKLESFIGANTRLKGEIKVQGTLRVDGAVEGDMEADWIILGEKAYLKGNAVAKTIVVGGSVDGNLTATEIVDIKQKGRINGDIVTNKLAVAEGGILHGRTTMTTEQPKAIEFAEDPLKAETSLEKPLGEETLAQGGG